MSIELHPDIPSLNPESLKYSIYNQLYNSFFNAQERKSIENPFGIEEGNDTSIRLHNTAYNFADAIAGSIAGEGNDTNGGILLDYLKKSGGDMLGLLRANYGFEAGIRNNLILQTYAKKKEENGILLSKYGIKITGDMDIEGGSLYLEDKQVLKYDTHTNFLIISGENIRFNNSNLYAHGRFLFGEDMDTGILISPDNLLIKGNNVYHSGNSNLQSVSWSMKDANIYGNMTISGQSVFSGKLIACNGVELGSEGKTHISIGEDRIQFNNSLTFSSGYGIRINNNNVLMAISEKDIQIGSTGGDLLFGNNNTTKARLLTNLTDHTGEYVLIDLYGNGYFPDSLTVRHHYGSFLMSSYREDSNDEGIIIHKNLRFGDPSGPILSGEENKIIFTSNTKYISPENGETSQYNYTSSFNYRKSSSKYTPLNRISDTLEIQTEADFVTFNVPLEAISHIGIENSFTRLTDGCLFFNDLHYLMSGSDGIKHAGNAYFLSDIGSERYSSGFAGSGWAITQNKTTGNISATFDEITIRKKMRIYEMEVQKIECINGSFWISDSCSGDAVIKLE